MTPALLTRRSRRGSSAETAAAKEETEERSARSSLRTEAEPWDGASEGEGKERVGQREIEREGSVGGPELGGESARKGKS